MAETTPLQRALDLSTNKIVSACAGAGKTYALSKRYCAIIDEFTKHNLKKPKSEWLGFKNILVITFTNKAAAEMSKRIYQDLHVLLQGEEITELKEQGVFLGEHIHTAPEEYKNWLRSTFSQNYIMTIDAFCGIVLRENAYLLNIDPQFKTSDELLAQKLYRETLNDFLNQQSKALRPELKHILQFTDKNGIIQFFNYFNKKKVFLESWLEFIERLSPDDIYQHWLSNYMPEFDVNLLISEVRNITSYHEYVKDGEKNTFAELREKIELFPGDSQLEQRRYFMAEVLPYFLSGKNEYYSDARYIQTKKSFINNDIYSGFKDSGNALIEKLSKFIPEDKVLFFPSNEDINSIKVFKDLITLYDEFESALWRTQNKKNYLTFNDVIIKTRELLSQHEQVRKKYSYQFKHILVDEFQDTNNLRWEIIKHVAKKTDGTLREKGLFIVGDKKQSIYRFQQADVEVMNVAQNELEEVTDGALIAFNDNYRSSKKYIDHVINPLFSKIFTQPEYSFEASFEETTFPENRTKAGVCSETVCEISIVENNPNSKDYTPARHAALMAQKYLQWAEEQHIDEEVHVGVLLRNFIHIHEYLRAFQEQDIPFQIIGERNLFNQQEAYDLFHFISVLINPHDDTALTGLLRSPFFSVRDTLINNFKNRSLKKEKESIFGYMSRVDSYNWIVQTIRQWRQLSRNLPVNELLHTVLSEAHRELGYMSEVGGKQRLANIDKLMHLVSRLELEGSSLQELHDYLAYQIRYKSEIAQADIPEPAKVHIMTIHKAKGLEFPAVIIPELKDTKTQTEKGNIFHSRIAQDGMIEVGISIKEQIESKKSNFLEIIKKQDRIEQEAEDKRMFYVAVTRAKYRVALLAEYIGNLGKNSWWNTFVMQPMNLPKSVEEIENGDYIVPPHFNISTMSIDVLNERLTREIHEKEKPKTWDPPKIVQPKNTFQQVTPHDIMSSVNVVNPQDHEADGEKNEIGQAFGSIFHAIIENRWWKWNENISQIEEFVKNKFPLLSFDDIKSRLKKHLGNFTSSALFSKLEQIDPKNLFHEHPISGWMDNRELFLEVNGIIDLLYHDGDAWKVVDFKTDRTKQFHEQYTLQLQTYLWMVKQLYDIDAQAYIYYSSFNELREIPFSDDYWAAIFPGEKHPFTPSDLQTTPIESKIIEKINDEPMTVINLTTYHAKKMLRSLAAMKMLSPNIEITTLKRLYRMNGSALKKITPEISRMLVRKAAENYEISDGTIDLLAQAFKENFQQKKAFKSSRVEFEEIYKCFECLREQYHYAYESQIMVDVVDDYFSDSIVIINGFFKDYERDFDLIRKIATTVKAFFFMDSFGKNTLISDFPYSQGVWQKIIPEKIPDTYCTAFHSVKTEIAGIARHILDLKNKDIEFSEIQLAISSIDVYIPVIEKVFSAYGIPYRIFAPIPLIDQPLTNFIIGLLTIILSSEHLTWQTLSSVLLHPLIQSNDDLCKLDAFIRSNPVTYFSDVVEIQGIGAYRETIHSVIEAIAMMRLLPGSEDLSNLWNKVESFFQAHSIVQLIEIDEKLASVFSCIQRIINRTLDTYSVIGFPSKNDEVLRELKKQFKDSNLPRTINGVGVEVISYLESYNSTAKVLFVAGLAENYFPVPPKKNPLTKSIPHYEWHKSALLLNGWIRKNQQIYFSYPCHNITGDTLNPSILLEGMDIKKEQRISTSFPQTLRQYYLTCERRIIENPDLPVLQRHNDYLSEDIGPYKGQVNPDGSDRVLISASGMNTLIQCPMQYLFRDILKIKPLEYNEDGELRKSLGNHIHKALEEFGKADGFTILRNNFEHACSMLDKQLKQVLQKNHIHLENDLFLQRLYAPYIEGLTECYENNLLVSLLRFNIDNFAAYTPLLFEQDFGEHSLSSWKIFEMKNEVVKLHFRGIIDKISQHHDGGILASDYKTGAAPAVKDIVEFWDVQPLVYLLTLENHYNGKDPLFVYESTKDIATSKNQFTIQFANDGFLIKWKSRNEYKEHLVLRDEFSQFLLTYGEKVILGNFNIRERELYGKPCTYCDHYMMCRKNSMMNRCITINDILQKKTEE